MNRVRLVAVTVCLLVALSVAAYGVKEEGANTSRTTRPTEPVNPAPKVNPRAVVWRTPTPPAKPQAGDIWVNPRDGMEMVYIPPGEFILGTSNAQIDAWLKEHPADKREWFKREQPQCRVSLPGYWIGRTEVTNAQYLRFVRATDHRAPDYWKGRKPPRELGGFPVVDVSWDDANAYCAWAGDSLPTELQWEKAARGTDGRVFPWGSQWDRTRCRNFELITGRAYASDGEWDTVMGNWEQAHDPIREGPTAVGSYPAGAGPYGCLDMAGNVEQWCADSYDEEAYGRYAKGDLRPPRSGSLKEGACSGVREGPWGNLRPLASGTLKVLRGGSWGDGYVHWAHEPPLSGASKVVRGGSWIDGDPWYFRCAYRSLEYPVYLFNGLGFRCAREASP